LKPIKLKEVFPGFANELESLLNRKNEPIIAKQISELNIIDRCRCGELFCSTFYTSTKENLSGVGKIIELDPIRGMINVDTFDNLIIEIEVLDRDEIKIKLDEIFP
jgi:hypothetical protein